MRLFVDADITGTAHGAVFLAAAHLLNLKVGLIFLDKTRPTSSATTKIALRTTPSRQ